MIWKDGVLPENAPAFANDLSDDLLSFGYSLLSQGLRLADLNGDQELQATAFTVAAEAIEAVVLKGQVNEERDFHRVVAAAAYHLARYSARSYSLLRFSLTQANLSFAEKTLCALMLRDFNELSVAVQSKATPPGRGDDDQIAFFDRATLNSPAITEEDQRADEEEPVLALLTSALDDNYSAAISFVILALERGEQSVLEDGIGRLTAGLEVAAEIQHVPQWWLHRLTLHIVRGLWEDSFHQVLPTNDPDGGQTESWMQLRQLFIASLMRRGKSEIELWPSQVDAARRVLEASSSLVLSLPTSAGKTRIAELCILACVARGKRVIFVTPLRALSAQTETSLKRTFGPLGKTVSSLYGSIGASGTDVDALRSRDIVVATPEKLDFALRSDPELLDDVGLVVLDEGHMIGLGEREVRYEAQIQRLLLRDDSAQRRVICLSAILPDGDQLDDFVAWLTHDKPTGLIKSSWRPTRLRFGELEWKTDQARLTITVGDETPFIPRFISARKPASPRFRKTFPSDQRELCLAAAWQLVAEGQSVLIFCPQRSSVLPYATSIIELRRRGLIESVLVGDASLLSRALAVGTEWFGAEHPLVKCLLLGVAIHHGALPSPFRKEVEKLLRDGTLKVTISSPTLAQGLNLSASSVIFHGLSRHGETIKASEFRNVIGRAGRAYVDIEGLVLYPMFDKHYQRRREWAKLTNDVRGHEMESGLLRLVLALLKRMHESLGKPNLDSMLEYIAGQAAWGFQRLDGEDEAEADEARRAWDTHLMSLDTAILSLLGDAAIAEDEIQQRVEDALRSSLFERRLSHHQEPAQRLLRDGFTARARFIWSNTTSAQRRGYFLAGVGLATGKELDRRSTELEALLLSANMAIGQGRHNDAITSIEHFADICFDIQPFTPRRLQPNWRDVLRCWLSGESLLALSEDGDPDQVVSFVEQAFVYNLPWAMEAVRVRATAHHDPFSDDISLLDYPRAHAVAAVEAGTLSIAAAVLIQTGFGSREGAIKAVADTKATFDSLEGLREWLASRVVVEASDDDEWPTATSHRMWLDFISPNGFQVTQKWTASRFDWPVDWHGTPPEPGTPLRIGGGAGKEHYVYSADYIELGVLAIKPEPNAIGICLATATRSSRDIELRYLGPDDLMVF